MICPNCGHQNRENAKFCEECGIVLPSRGKASRTARAPRETRQPPPSAPARVEPAHVEPPRVEPSEPSPVEPSEPLRAEPARTEPLAAAPMQPAPAARVETDDDLMASTEPEEAVLVAPAHPARARAARVMPSADARAAMSRMGEHALDQLRDRRSFGLLALGGVLWLFACCGLLMLAYYLLTQNTGSSPLGLL